VRQQWGRGWRSPKQWTEYQEYQKRKRREELWASYPEWYKAEFKKAMALSGPELKKYLAALNATIRQLDSEYKRLIKREEGIEARIAQLGRERQEIMDREAATRGTVTKFFCGEWSRSTQQRVIALGEEQRRLKSSRKSPAANKVLSLYRSLRVRIHQTLKASEEHEKELLRKAALEEAHSVAAQLERERERAERERLLRTEEEKRRVHYEAVAAAYHGATREQADRIKRDLKAEQTTIFPNCPYCFGPLGDNPHPDHIYPVTRGGLSEPENLVYVCARCNLKKQDRTLREFIRREGLDREAVEIVLEQLGKRF